MSNWQLQSKENYKMKKQFTGWAKIFANYVSNNGLIFRIQNELLQLKNIKK